ncbi:MAG: hypothetical protein LKF88_04015 [Microbacteriaceae bacterium]|jgi:hypothetical protein|nr:hypothetical protein [Microbacteriaceae bacterium]MCI1207358.1 hypothetical protein [Microbacteriaceae bacterium]
MTESRRHPDSSPVQPVAAPVDQDSGLGAELHPSRTELRARERERSLQSRFLRHRSVAGVWGLAALFFAYLFWEGAAVFGSTPALLATAGGTARVWAAIAGMVLPLVGYAVGLWLTAKLTWWRALLVFAAGWSGCVAVWLTVVWALSVLV